MWNNHDKFDHLIALAATKCTEEDAQELNLMDTADVNFDASYYRKRNKTIHKYKSMPKERGFKVITIRVVAAIMITIAVASLFIGCVPGLREAIYNAIVEWCGEYFAISYETPGSEENETEYDEESAAETEAIIIAPTYIAEVRKPTNLPEGVWEDVLTQNSSHILIDYYHNDSYLFSFTQRVLYPFDQYVDSEDAKVTYIKINDSNATVVECQSKNDINIYWNDEEYSYHIFSTECDVETLVKYAESVK